MINNRCIVGLELDELTGFIKELGFPGYRAKQLFGWLHQSLISDFSQMHNLPKEMMAALQGHGMDAHSLQTKQTRVSQDGTKKYLFLLNDGQTMETVCIPETDRMTVCVSSQVGCAMGCTFCATGLSGYTRNLTAGEIVDQVRQVQAEADCRITNVVFMGMGEPLANYDNVVKAVRIVNDAMGLHIGMRRITVSTCGLVPQIYRLATDLGQVVLAVSLHAANDRKRAQCMPIANRHPLLKLMEACHAYVTVTNRRITLEYALIDGFNDTEQDVHELKELLRGLLCHMNVIPLNPVSSKHRRPGDLGVHRFVDALMQAGIPASVRQERGVDIEAACGQLRQQAREVHNEDIRAT